MNTWVHRATRPDSEVIKCVHAILAEMYEDIVCVRHRVTAPPLPSDIVVGVGLFTMYEHMFQ